MDKPKLWTKNFLIVSTANFFLYFTFYLLMVTITIFATEKFHASPSEAGLASGIFVIGLLIARIFCGRYIDQIGWKKTLYIGFVLFLITTCLYVLVNSMGFLLVVRFLNGAAMGIASTATGTIVAKIIPNKRRGEGTGYYALSLTVAASIGPFLGMFITQHATFYMNFIVCIIFLAFSFIAVFFIKIPKLEFTKEELKKKKGLSLHHFFEVKAIPISIISCIIALGYSSILTFITTYAKEINLVYVSSFFFIVYAVFVLVSRPFTGRWFDEKGENFVMYPAILLLAMALFSLSQTHNGFSLLLAGALLGLGYGTTSSSVQAIAVKVSPKHRIGLATSTNFIFQDLGVGIGPFLLGYFVPLIGYRGLYMMMTVVILVCLFLYYLLHGRTAMCVNEDVKSKSA
ncbi:MFS transporter [Terrisporobacter mayombei]|uniref:MFS-type transporter YhhS n=1 Tax=Terrisporobacter mayombei TaxID=1541 RepID=A0ABY9PWZ4_9FIRM|nr:MFS transporter [Terrisporobacter mayombei]MCC3868039.1 MFS transporter [Terrisporobacter mayombei]WMT80177.1 putative MFS-type transporter YhhS [Terrisporobacter mayombei]